MKAIYKNRIYNVVDSAADITLQGKDLRPFDVSFGDPELTIDPTDAELADATNLAEWYELDEGKAVAFRRWLRGE